MYRIAEDRALVVTLDFFTPIVDDPFDFGRIAAANALSDVYAMGATPLFALNLLAFPRSLLGEGLVEEIIRGGAEKASEAGVPVLGGHSIDDTEPKYGMVVIGEGDPDRLLANDGARIGDVLVLTKPLGTGIETSMDVEFSVQLHKGRTISLPRVENDQFIISVGSQPEFSSSLNRGLRMATSDMVNWLVDDTDQILLKMERLIRSALSAMVRETGVDLAEFAGDRYAPDYTDPFRRSATWN